MNKHQQPCCLVENPPITSSVCLVVPVIQTFQANITTNLTPFLSNVSSSAIPQVIVDTVVSILQLEKSISLATSHLTRQFSHSLFPIYPQPMNTNFFQMTLTFPPPSPNSPTLKHPPHIPLILHQILFLTIKHHPLCDNPTF